MPQCRRPTVQHLATCGWWAVLVLPLVASSAASAQDRRRATAGPPAADPTESPALLREPELFTRGIQLIESREGNPDAPPKNGFYVDFGGMPTGAGWISAGPGYRHRLFDDRALVDASTGISWHGYKTVQARFEIGDVRGRSIVAGSEVLWQDLTQVHYWGPGPDSLEANASEYRIRSLDLIGYASGKLRGWLTVSGAIGWLRSPSLSSSVGPFGRDYPYTRDAFPDDPAFALPSQPDFIHADLAVTADTRDHRGYPTRGGLYRSAWAGYSDRDTGRFSFRRYEAEALQLVPIVPDLWVLALHGWTVGSDTATGGDVPLYLVPSLGGGNTIRGFHNYRFHDRNLLLVSVESRWALFRHVDAAVFADRGNVAARFGDLDVSTSTYGVGFRIHTRRTTLVRWDIGHSREGWNFLLKVNDPFRLSRLTRRTATVPFVP